MASSSTSSSTSPSKSTYDVFLSFRGSDTRHNFTSHLYAALRRKHIHTFIDETDLDRGEEISPTLLKTIEESKFSVIVFSENYASSPWCLDELVKVMECTKTIGQKAVPIFYQVDPSDVSDLSGKFGAAFEKEKKRFSNSKERVQRWCSALEEATNLSGWDSSNYSNEVELIEKVSEYIMQKLYPTSYTISSELVGINSHIEQILSYLSMGSKDVRFVGLWGMGGVGKTTIAEIIYSHISNQFERCYFLRNVREESEKNGVIHLRKKMFSQLLGIESMNIEMLHVVPTFIKDSLNRMKVVVVLDDISDPNQLEAFGVGEGWFGPGSRILLTSRDKKILNIVDEICIYHVEGLNDCDALELLSMKAFKQKYPLKDYTELSKRVLYYAKGLPLALKVLGSHLFKRTPMEWEIELNKLYRFPDSTIQKILEISFESLDDVLKDIFLDIACFFVNGDKGLVIDALDGCGFPTSWGINRLSEKCLITVTTGHKLQMHDLIKEMGQEIARRMGNRLFNHKDVIHTLTTDMRNETAEGIVLHRLEAEEIHSGFGALSWMPKLRLLMFYDHPFFPKNFELDHPPCLSSNLSLLHWYKYPFKSLRSNFPMKNLVQLIMPRSNLIQLWDGYECSQNLKILDLQHSVHLRRLPDLSSATKLECLNLSYCKILEALPPCIENLKNLKFLGVIHCENLRSIPSLMYLNSLQDLSLTGCVNLKNFPKIPRSIERLQFSQSGVEDWPTSLDFLKNDIVLDVGGCRNLSKVNISGNFEMMILDKTAIQELPSSIKYLSSSLKFLGMRECEDLEILPDSIRELKCLETLYLDGCLKLSKLPPLNGLSSLQKLSLEGSGIVEIPSDIVSLASLRSLVLGNCKRLRSLPLLPWQLETLQANDCTLLQAASVASISLVYFSNPSNFPIINGNYVFNFCNCIKLDNHTRRKIMADARWRIEETVILPIMEPSFTIGLPGSEIPEWFSYQSYGNSMVVQLPLCSGHSYLSLVLCVVVELERSAAVTDPLVFQCRCCFKYDSGIEFTVNSSQMYINGIHESDHVLLWNLHSPWARIRDVFSGKEALFQFRVNDAKFKVIRCGIHLVLHPRRPCQ